MKAKKVKTLRIEKDVQTFLYDTVSEEVKTEIICEGVKHTIYALPEKLDLLERGFKYCISRKRHMNSEVFPLLPSEIYAVSDELLALNKDSNGCIHIAGLWKNGIKYTGTDISRHNAIYKVIGACLCEEDKPSDYVLFISGRVTASVMELCSYAGIRAVVSKGAVTELSVKMALENGISLYGFSGKGRVNRYA